MIETEAARAAEQAARLGYGRLVALLAARGQDLAAAEDALADAFAAALAHWPTDGVPANPQAWLLTAARRRLTDAARRAGTTRRATPELLFRAGLPEDPETDLPDHRLALLLACAHPAIEPTLRAPLMLQVVLGLDAARIAGAFLVSPAAMAQHLVRAKRRLREAGTRFALPDRATVAQRLPDVLAAIYASYTLDAVSLADEALWLARLCAGLAPTDAEALGLAALLLHLEARRPAGRTAAGDYVPLSQQDPANWNAALQSEAEHVLRQASALAQPGRYQIEAAIASAHAERARTGRTDWAGIVSLYDRLLSLTGSPVVAVNRAAALAEHGHSAAALLSLRALAQEPRLRDYQPYWAALAAVAARAGEPETATAARQRAAGLANDPALRRYLLRAMSL